MCGIGAVSRAEHTGITHLKSLIVDLAKELEPRGHHATGFAWAHPDDGHPWYWKRPGRASVVASGVPLPNGVGSILAHTRWATNGNPKDNVNNHPMIAPGVTLVHNGILTNDLELLELLNVEAVSGCDSEALAWLVANGPEELGSEPWELLELVEGSAAIAWLDMTSPHVIHLARLADRHGVHPDRPARPRSPHPHRDPRRPPRPRRHLPPRRARRGDGYAQLLRPPAALPLPPTAGSEADHRPSRSRRPAPQDQRSSGLRPTRARPTQEEAVLRRGVARVGESVMGELMTKPRPYPVPDRPRWTVCVQFLNGTQLFGNSDEEILERWLSIGMWAANDNPDYNVAYLKRRYVNWARVQYSAGLIGIGPDTPADQFLDACAAEGLLSVSRK